MPSSARLGGLDALRGIASLAVCWLHLTNSYSIESVVRASGSRGWLGVQAFFVISGFVIPYAMHKGGYVLGKNWATFIGKRVLRIDPPYLAAALLALVLAYAAASVPQFRGQQPHFSAMQLLLHLGYLNAIVGYPWLNDVFWTLAIEFQYYLVISLVFGWLGSRQGLRRWVVAVPFLVLPFFFHLNTWVFQFLNLFLLGITAFQYRIGVVGRLEACALLALASLSVWLTRDWMVMCVGLGTTLVILANWEFGRWRPLMFLGSISYSLYLIHVPIGGRVVNLGRRYVETQAGEWLLSGLALVICLVCATLFWRWIERPAQQWASRIQYRKQGAAIPAGPNGQPSP